MKYIFLFLLLVTAGGVGAQGVDYKANPNFYTDNVAQSNASGGLLNTSDSNTSGGQVNTSGGNFSGGQINTSGGNYSGGQLQEISKPNLTIVGITNWFVQILNYIGILIFTAALVCFLYGVFLLMFVHGASDESRSKGKKFITWGIVSLFVMTSTWGLVNILRSSIFGSSGGSTLYIPQLK
ncbi:MAG: hypothetical protein V4686_00250 [Patescibacteria group bacterium]